MERPVLETRNQRGSHHSLAKRGRTLALRIALAVLAAALLLLSTSTYVRRMLFWNTSDLDDYRRFPYRTAEPAEIPFHFNRSPEMEAEYAPYFESITYVYRGKTRVADFDTYLAETRSTAFIAIKDDTIIAERYYNGHARDSIQRSFSTAKSFTGLLVGIAIDEGYIESVGQPAAVYVPELAEKGYGEVTIRELLMMSAPFAFTSGPFPWNDDTILYYTPNLREATLAGLRPCPRQETHFHYSNYSTQLLAMVLERATDTTVTAFFEEQLWQQMGTEYGATWSLNREGGIEQAASGLNARAIDYVKLARLYLEGGRWEGSEVVSEAWISESITPEEGLPEGYYSKWERDQEIYYKYQWWGHLLPDGGYNYFMKGAHGQVIYVCPQKKLILARFGYREGEVDYGWQATFRLLCEEIE